jgi:hypothetical protein
MDDKIIGAIASALNLDATELTADLKEGENWLEAGKLSETLFAKISAQVKAAKEAQYKRGIRERAKSVESFLSKSGFVNAEKLEGDALLEAYTEHLKASADTDTAHAGKEPAKMSKDDLAKLPEVKALVNEAKQQAGQQIETLKTQYDTDRTKWQRDRILDVAQAKLPAYLKAANINLEVPGVADGEEKRIKAIMSMLPTGDMGLNEKGELVFMDSDGQPKTDDFGKPLDFKKHVTELGANLFGIRKVDPSKSGVAPQNGQKPGANDQRVYSFADKDAFSAAILVEADPAKRSKMLKDFQTAATE